MQGLSITYQGKGDSRSWQNLARTYKSVLETRLRDAYEHQLKSASYVTAVARLFDPSVPGSRKLPTADRTQLLFGTVLTTATMHTWFPGPYPQC